MKQQGTVWNQEAIQEPEQGAAWEQNQKRENLLNLALATPEAERKKSLNLNTGYFPEVKRWELIVKYSDASTWPEEFRERGILVSLLLGGYGILLVPENLLDYVSTRPEIEYMEKPKRLFFAVNQGKAASCIAGEGGSTGDGGGREALGETVWQRAEGLSGSGILVAVLDSGIDYFHPDFRNEDGSTRIYKLWDQVLDRVFTAEEINEALSAPDRRAGLLLVPSVDLSGHGTAVAGIAAGNGRGSSGRYRGVAFASRLLVVKLGVPETDSFPRTTQLMRALDFAVREAASLSLPVAVNVSFGNTYGSHDGTSLLETFFNQAAAFGRTVIVTGSGNEGASQGHAGGRLESGTGIRTRDLQLSIGPYEISLSIQLWKLYADVFSISLIAPDGQVLGPVPAIPGPARFSYRETDILIYYGEPAPYSSAQEIYFDFIPQKLSINSGIWTLRLTTERIVDGRFDLWLPSAAVLNPETKFLTASPETTLTIPSTAAAPITVGAYDANYQSYADFSGRGYTRLTGQVKPELAAPGVGITAPKAGGGYDTFTGTSFAAPFVTGAAALLMQYGITDGKDPFLFNQKVKSYLIKGARQLPGLPTPNGMTGWGALCVRDSLPI